MRATEQARLAAAARDLETMARGVRAIAAVFGSDSQAARDAVEAMNCIRQDLGFVPITLDDALAERIY